MNTYEIESKLRDKADKMEVHALQGKIKNLRNKISELNDSLSRANGRISNQRHATEQLIQFLIEREGFEDSINQLHELKQYL